MKPAIALAAVAVAVLTAGCADADLYGLPVEHDTPAPAVTVLAEPAPNPQIPVTYWMHPDGPGQCLSAYNGTAIPCRNVVHVCVADADGHLTSKFLPTVYVCGPDSPTWRTVCTDRPADEWAWYGYSDEECITARPPADATTARP